MMRLNKKVIMLTALLIVIGVVVSCSQPTIDKPSIEEPTNPNIQNIINELNRLQNIVYYGNTITSNATKQDIDNFYNYIDEASSNGVDTNMYLDVWGNVSFLYESKINELNNLTTPPESWSEEQKTEYNNQIKEFLKTDNNTSYASLNEKIAKIKEIQNNIGGGQVNPGESSLSIGGVLVENGVVTLTTTNNFDVVKNGDISIKNLTININPTKPSELNIKTLYNLVQELSSYGITPTINTNNQVTYTINGGDEYGKELNSDTEEILNNDLYGMGNLITDKLDIKTDYLDGFVYNRTITATNTNIKITGNYLDIGENTFIANNGATYTIPETIKLTNKNSYYDKDLTIKPFYPIYKPISQEKMIEQFTLFGLNKEMATAPKFDIELGNNENLFILAKSLLNKYSTFSVNEDGADNKLTWGTEHTFNGYEEGKSLYNGDVLNTEHQAVKNPINIKLAEFLGQLPSNAVLDMSGKDSNKIYTFDAPDANLIINGDASNVSLSNGYTAGFIIANGASPITIGYTDLYKYSQLPKDETGKFTSSNITLDFRGVNLNVDYEVYDIIVNQDIQTAYIDEGTLDFLYNKIRKTGSNRKFIDVYNGTSEHPYPKTIQEFEAIGNDKLRNPPSNSVSKVNFIDPDTNTILYSALNSRSLCEKNFRYFHKIGDFRLEGKETIG